MKTLILLIDFYGHPVLNSEPYNNQIRYSSLLEIVSAAHIKKNQCIIYSNNDILDEKLKEIRDMGINNGIQFYYGKPEDQNVIEHFTKRFQLDREKSQIILGGVNTSGCVYKTKSIGAYYWSKAGFKTKIYLPMTIEYEQKGINDLERNINGFATLYKQIKKDKCFDIDIVKNFDDLELSI